MRKSLVVLCLLVASACNTETFEIAPAWSVGDQRTIVFVIDRETQMEIGGSPSFSGSSRSELWLDGVLVGGTPLIDEHAIRITRGEHLARFVLPLTGKAWLYKIEMSGSVQYNRLALPLARGRRSRRRRPQRGLRDGPQLVLQARRD